MLSLPIIGCVLDPPESATLDQEVALSPFTTTPAWTVWINSNCSATVLDERWLLTSANCLELEAAQGAMTVHYASAAGVRTEIYSGHVHRYYHFAYSASAENDVGLVYLDSYGLDLAAIGRAALATTTPGPWEDNTVSDAMELAGWGMGGVDCAAVAGYLRRGTGLHVDYNPGNIFFASAATGNVRACPGDSGAPYLQWRGVPGNEGYIQFAVHSRIALTTLPVPPPASSVRHQGSLIENNHEWIEDTIAAHTPMMFGQSWSPGSYAGTLFTQHQLAASPDSDLRGFESKCMQAGNPATRVTCNHATTQLWSFTVGGMIQAYAPPGFRRQCLEVIGGSTANGTDLRTATCNSSLAQRFAYTPAGELRSALAWNKCVEAPTGSPVQLFDCNGSPPQLWVP